jgi:putative spermidine/putrescine transport system ATP-binding protein
MNRFQPSMRKSASGFAMNSNGCSVRFVTHDQEEALLLGDKIGVMQQGRFEQVGTPSEIYNHPRSLSVARFIGDFNILAPHDIGVLFDRKTDLNWAVHPQALEIVKAPTKKQLNGSFYATQATITTENILGTVIRYTANSHGQTLKVDVLNTPEMIRLKVGDSVWLRISHANLCELPG